MNLLSIIIPTRNRPNKLQNLLISLYKQNNKRFEIIVVSSSDPKFYKKERIFIKKINISQTNTIKHIKTDIKNKSFQCNLGLHNIGRGVKFFAIVDDDCLLKKGWADTVIKLHLKHPSYLAIGGGYIDYHSNSLINKYLNNHVCALKSIDKDSSNFLGGNISFKLKGFNLHRLKFDNRYSVCEDWALSQEILCRKESILLHPKMSVYHDYRHTAISSISRFIQYGYEEYFISINYPNSTFPINFRRNILDLLRITKKIPSVFIKEFHHGIKGREDFLYVYPLIIFYLSKITGVYIAIIKSVLCNKQYPND